MSVEIKSGVASFVAVDTDFDVFGDANSFGIEIINAESGSVVTNEYSGAVFEEVMWTDPGHSATTSGTQLAGASSITVNPASNTVVAGDRISDGSNIYYVTDVSGDKATIYIKGSLAADIADATTLSTVGNTGIYKIPIQITDTGDYFVNFSHPEMGHT